MSTQLVGVLAALADETRWTVLARLAEEPASASALARRIPVSRQAIVKHLEVLRIVGLVQGRQQGRELVFHPLGSTLSRTAGELEKIGRAWEARLQRIKQLAEND